LRKPHSFRADILATSLSLQVPGCPSLSVGDVYINPVDRGRWKDKPMKNDTSKANPGKPANKPVHEIRVGGIRASIWRNDTANGPRFNTTFERSYRDGETWKSSDSFGRDDLMNLSFVCAEALRWIVQQHDQPAAPTRS
jgi:hypothetical protein